MKKCAMQIVKCVMLTVLVQFAVFSFCFNREGTHKKLSVVILFLFIDYMFTVYCLAAGASGAV